MAYGSHHSYSTGLLDCFSDFGICVQTTFCPCVTTALNTAKSHDRDCGCDSLLICNNPYWDRQLIRERKDIGGDVCSDICACLFCYPCFLCQDAREIKDGFDQPLRASRARVNMSPLVPGA